MPSPKARVLILLFRRDLRIHDNPLFHFLSQPAHKTQNPTHLLPLYIFSPTCLELSGLLLPNHPSPFPECRSRLGNFWRCGPRRAKFIAESVWDLKTRLKTLGSDLILRVGRPEAILAGILEGLRSGGAEVAGVCMVSSVGTEEHDEEAAIRQVVEKEGVRFQLLEDGGYLYSLASLPFPISETPDVFTIFRKRLEPLRSTIPPSFPAPTSLLPLPPTPVPQPQPFTIPPSLPALITALLSPLKDLGLPGDSLTMPADAKTAHPFPGGEGEARKRVRHLLSSGVASRYKETRNGLVGEDFSTKLAGFLSQGCISARCINASLCSFEDGKDPTLQSASGHGQGENPGTAAIRFELLWRDYFRLCALRFGPRLFAISGYRGDRSYTWTPLPVAASQFSRFLRGETGTPLVDASMRELYLTGWTSNRARQNVASYLTKRLGIDWRLGAEWYEAMLVDYEVASNWGNWQYLAGVGNDPRSERMFNQEKQRRDYDKGGEYVRMWLGEGWEGRGEKPLVEIKDVVGGARGGGKGSGRGRGRRKKEG